MPSPSGSSISSSEDSTLDESLSDSTSSRKFRFPLPFDPIRILAGVLARWPWILIGMIIFGTLGTIVGIRNTGPSFAVTALLIRQYTPQIVKASETGQAFRPAELNDATLHATLYAKEPLDKASERAKNGINSDTAKRLIETSQLEGTDIFYITYHSPISADDALTFTEIWAEEINAYTKRLQQSEARAVRAILEKEVASMEKEIESIDLKILNFSKEKDFFGGNSQVTAVLGKLSQIELQLDTARSSVESKKSQLASLTEQIRHQSPVELQIKVASEELANLRSTYTDENPLVQAKLESIEYLKQQITKLKKTGKVELEAYTGTPLGNQIYLTITGLRNELLEAQSRIISLGKILQSTEARLAEFPEIMSDYQALQNKRNVHIEGLSLMTNRLKEAEIFAYASPGYWKVFQKPDPSAVVTSSLIKKPALLGLVGAIAGAGLAIILALFLTHRTSRRSVLECCAATKAPLISQLPNSLEKDSKAAVDHFWITYLAPRFEQGIPILFWTEALNPDDEHRFWTMLGDAASADAAQPLRVLDLSPDSLWNDEAPSESLVWLTDLPPDSEGKAPIIYRASSLPKRDSRAMLQQVDQWISVVAGQKESLRKVIESRSLTEAYLPACSGTVAWTDRPKGMIREAADVVSSLITKRFS